MLTPDNNEVERGAIDDATDITIGALLRRLAAESDKPLVFFYEGRAIQPGYHVTEVKAGAFQALDCGANPEAWSEMFVQLWDITEGERTHMTAGKFAAIIGKVAEHVALDTAARLTFEVSDGVRPMQLYRAALPSSVGTELHTQLSARPASCKPRDRWLEARQNDGACSGMPCCL